MSLLMSLEAHEWGRFSVPHSVRLMGEEQHLLDAGSISVASTLRLRVEAEETSGGFSLRFGSRGEEDGDWEAGDEPVAELAVRWENALQGIIVDEPADLEGLDIEIDFGPLWRICPPKVLGISPAVAVALAVAVTAHRGAERQLTEVELAEAACRLHYAASGAGRASVDRSYSDALMSIVGGVGYAEPHGERLNVQQLIPPESLLLVLAPGVEDVRAAHQRDEAVLIARQKAREAGAPITDSADAAFSAVFALEDVALSAQEVALLYGLMRVRQMTEGFIEHLGEPHVDNDMLAEICDEESAILGDYFGFPAVHYDRIRAGAARAGALGTKLTWAFDSHPAAIVVAPGRRMEVGEALTNTFPGVYCLLVDMDPTGLLPGEEAPPYGGEF